MNPAQQREKVLRDALEYMQRVWMTYWSRPAPVITDALAAADAIPDAPIPAAPLPHAPVIADGRQVGTLVTAQRVDLRESPPVPSRAEPVLSAREFALVAADILCDSATDETAIGSLTVEINRRDWAVTRDTERATQPPATSRAELIELIAPICARALVSREMAPLVLDALIKAGAVRT